MAGTMDAIVGTLAAGGRGESMYPFPAEAISTPAVVVGYPTVIEFNATFRRGSDRAEFPVWFVVTRNDAKGARDAISAIVASSQSIKDLLDGDLGGVFDEEPGVKRKSPNASRGSELLASVWTASEEYYATDASISLRTEIALSRRWHIKVV